MLILGALALAGLVIGQSTCDTDLGNGVHVPGNIPANLQEPLQHRLAFAGSGMVVSWSTYTQLDEPQVFFGEHPERLDQVATSNISRTYPTSRTWNNHVKLSGLKSATKYYYKVSNTNAAYAAYRPLYTFTTARAAGDMTPFSIASFADLGLMGHDGLSTRAGTIGAEGVAVLGSGETNTIQSLLLLKDTYEWLGHFGDVGYADYFLKESIQGYFGTDNSSVLPSKEKNAERYESLSEQFFDQMSPITAEKPWMVAPGNHEANCDNGLKNFGYQYCLEGQTNFTFYIEHFEMPSAESKGLDNFWYSFDYGMVHMIVLDTETDLGHGRVGPVENSTWNLNGPFGLMDQQIEWLKADLAAVDRTKTPWVVVGLHRPWYVSVSPVAYPAWQAAFEQIFYDYQVDLYTTGHVHVYERFEPMFNGTIDANGLNNPRAPWSIVNGAAGHYDGLDVFDKVKANGSAHGIDGVFGWGRMTFHNATHLTYEYIASANSSVIDSATLYKKRDFGTPKPKTRKPPGLRGGSKE